jgi:alkylhydroperoxidase family enzyme
MTTIAQHNTAPTASKYFPTHDLNTAPIEARPLLEATAKRFGFLPLASARHATAPALVEGFGAMLELFEHTSLSATQREAVALVLAGKFDCALCRALHRRMAAAAALSDATITSLIAREGIEDPALRALAVFTERVVDTQGAVSDTEVTQFVEHGFTPRQALEVVVGIATYTLSIFANRMTRSESVR